MSNGPSPPTPQHLATAAAQSSGSIGFGYVVAISIGFLVIFSTVLLASYICYRTATLRRRGGHQRPDSVVPTQSDENSVYLPRIIFVAEDDESDSQNLVLGMEQEVINLYPKFVFSKRSGSGGNDTVCSICLCDYREAEMLRMLPDCKHSFHVTCVDTWLKLNASCPVCRNSPMPTPLSTPLQEVVPLSQYADGRRRQ